MTCQKIEAGLYRSGLYLIKRNARYGDWHLWHPAKGSTFMTYIGRFYTLRAAKFFIAGERMLAQGYSGFTSAR